MNLFLSGKVIVMIFIISDPAKRFTLRRFGKLNVLKKIKIKSMKVKSNNRY